MARVLRHSQSMNEDFLMGFLAIMKAGMTRMAKMEKDLYMSHFSIRKAVKSHE